MLNECKFIGRLGQDPEIRHSNDGTAFANFSIACTEKWKDKQTQEQRERTEWPKIVASGRLAEICGQYLRKGDLVYVSGKLVTRKWQNQSGQDQYSTEFRINEMKMLNTSGGNAQNQQQSQQPQNGGSMNQQQYMQQPTPQQQPQPQQNPACDFDDDIPF